ncbi:gamma-butyrolactone biosynthesis protein [Streptomyces sp. WAC 01529]|uniref:ScbA/BarX family gamma-butyrolactone biosynthesis protein n=1 Tax=Streptomyces sp. WAC 01529 TaxID=2203205 RepID=UPI000F71FD6C|nr:ScbA/BarX family gamma-butyrolactone biosynthesis protein [Streptomyces sp. WAC 01529]AZM55304.1 gamma-butyrolactone biosynthesis protein [Streptomyces sp. WAC 01529]
MASTAPGLTFLRPVPRELVHRSSIAEVFVTDGCRVSDSRFSVAAQWPRDHALYHPDEQGFSDPMLFAETIRQAMLYVAHEHFEVPIGHRFVGRDLSFEITDPAALRIVGVPVPVVLETEWTWEEGRPRGARLDVRLFAGAKLCGSGTIRVYVMDDRRYGLLRRMAWGGEAPPAPAAVRAAAAPLVPPRRVGRLRWKDCVLERCWPDGDWQLRLDRDHAVLFDHPTDHVPLMVLMEGFRQLGHLCVHETVEEPLGGQAFTLVGMEVECAAFAELNAPIRLVVEQSVPGRTPADAYRLRVAALQGDTLLARTDMTWAGTGARSPREAAGHWPEPASLTGLTS